MIRESPTRASNGQTTANSVPGGYAIDSFFDIYTEASLDGGQTWVASLESVRMESVPEPATLTVLALGALAMIRRRAR